MRGREGGKGRERVYPYEGLRLPFGMFFKSSPFPEVGFPQGELAD